MKVLVLICALLFSMPAFAIAVDEAPLQNPAQEETARALMKELRCLVCQNQSIEDSDADLARDLRRIVRERVAAGDTPDEVKAYLVARYGDWVLLEPPLKGRTIMLWAGPFIMLLLGGVMLLILRKRKAAEDTPLSADEEERLRTLLERGGEP